MKASVVDLRYRMREILKALDRNETVTILYHGKEKGVINPISHEKLRRVSDHPFFGMSREEGEPVESTMERLRGGRY